MTTNTQAPLFLHDTFQAIRADNDFGLNDNLAQRQSGLGAPSAYARLPGVWFAAPPAEASLVRVDPAQHSLDFLGFSAVRLVRPVRLPLGGTVRVSFRVVPVVGSQTGQGWVSVLFTDLLDSTGWPTNQEMLQGFLLRSNGGVQLFSQGVERAVHWHQSPPSASLEYDVALELRLRESSVPNDPRFSYTLEGSINHAEFHAVLLEGVTAPRFDRLFLSLGAHYHEADTHHSSIRELRVWAHPAP